MTGGTWRAASGGTLRLNGANVATNAATIVIDGPTSNIYIYNATSGTTSALAGLTTNAANGIFSLASGRDFTTNPAGGTLTNNGTLNLGAGSTLAITGAFTPPGSTLHTDIGGPNASTDFGQVTATGAASVNGSLDVTLVGGYDPGFAINFPVVVGSSRSGSFSSFTGGTTPSGRILRDRYDSTSAIVAVRPLAPSAAGPEYGQRRFLEQWRFRSVRLGASD